MIFKIIGLILLLIAGLLIIAFFKVIKKEKKRTNPEDTLGLGENVHYILKRRKKND